MESSTDTNASTAVCWASLPGLPPELLAVVCQWLPSTKSIVCLSLSSKPIRVKLTHVISERIRCEYPEVPQEQYAQDPIGFYLCRKQIELKLYQQKGYWRSLTAVPYCVEACTVLNRRDGISEVIFSAKTSLSCIGCIELTHQGNRCALRQIHGNYQNTQDVTRWLGRKEPAYCEFGDFGTAMVDWQPITDTSSTAKGMKIIVRSIKQPTKERIVCNDWPEIRLLSAHQSYIFAMGVKTQKENEAVYPVLSWDALSNKKRVVQIKESQSARMCRARRSHKHVIERVPNAWLQYNQKTPPIFAWMIYAGVRTVWFANYQGLDEEDDTSMFRYLTNLWYPTWLQQVPDGLLMCTELESCESVGKSCRRCLLPYSVLTTNNEHRLEWNKLGLSSQYATERIVPIPIAQITRPPIQFRSVPTRTSSVRIGPLSCTLTSRANFVDVHNRRDASLQDSAGYLYMLKRTQGGTSQSATRRFRDVTNRGDTRYHWGYWKGQPTLVRLDRAVRSVPFGQPNGLTWHYKSLVEYARIIRVSVFECFPDQDISAQGSQQTPSSSTPIDHRSENLNRSLKRTPPTDNHYIRFNTAVAQMMIRDLSELRESLTPALSRLLRVLTGRGESKKESSTKRRRLE